MRKVAVIGSSGAIGRAFVDHYINDLSINRIFSFSRSSIGIDNNKVKHFSIDIENESSIENAAKSVEEINFDEIIIASGLLHTNEFGPEKSIKDLKADNILKVLNKFSDQLLRRIHFPRKQLRAFFYSLPLRLF